MKKSEMPWTVEPEKVSKPEPRPGMVWVTRTSEGRRYIGQGIADLTLACKTLGTEKVVALANRALGIEEKVEVQPLLKSGKYAEAQAVALAWKPEEKKTRAPKAAPTVTVKADGKGKVSTESLLAALEAAGIKVVTA